MKGGKREMKEEGRDNDNKKLVTSLQLIPSLF